MIKFTSFDNGDIKAETVDGLLMGMWLHEKEMGTFRISNDYSYLENNPGVGKINNLTGWITLMTSFR